MQETGREGEMTERINTPPPLEETQGTRRRFSKVSIPTDRFKMPDAPRSKRGAKSSIAASLRTLKAVLKESWAQRPEPTAPLRRRNKYEIYKEKGCIPGKVADREYQK